MRYPQSPKFKIPRSKAFDRTRDPLDHLENYKTRISDT